LHQTKEQKIFKAVALILIGPFAAFLFYKEPMVIVHAVLIVANVVVVYGGAQLAGADYSNPDSPHTKKILQIGEITRGLGQGLFLACNLGLLFAILVTIQGEKKAGRKLHTTLVLLLIAWVPLVLRGIFGLMQAVDFDVSPFCI
jgi:hypothetical protein